MAAEHVTRPALIRRTNPFKDRSVRPSRFPLGFFLLALLALIIFLCIMPFREWIRTRRARKLRHRQSLDAARAKPPSNPGPFSGVRSGALGAYLGDIWSSPPELLLGSDDHPFFLQFSSPLISSQSHNDAVNPPADNQLQDEPSDGPPGGSTSATIPQYEVVATQPVYPFIPAPTIAMEVPLLPTPPESASRSYIPSSSSDCAQVDVGQPQSSSAPLANVPAEALPATQAIETPPGVQPRTESPSASQQPLQLASCTTGLSTNKRLSQSEPSSPAEAPPYPLYYTRSVPNSGLDREVLLHGQIWRSRNKECGWRRNQWVVEILIR